MKSFEKIENIRDIRKKLGLNQMDFWSRIGVTQSGGSRYESGRNMPEKRSQSRQQRQIIKPFKKPSEIRFQTAFLLSAH